MGSSTYTKTRRQEFARLFRAALQSDGIGVRTLARRLANGDPERFEIERRKLNKYLAAKAVPTETNRHRIEDELGLERDSLNVDDDEEDGSLLVDLFALVRARRRSTKPSSLEATG